MTSLFIRATPKRRWNRNIVYYALKGLYDLAYFKELGYSIDPPHMMANRKEIGLNITFKSMSDKKTFMGIGLTQYYWSKLEEVCKDGLLVRSSDDALLAAKSLSV